MSRVCYEMSFRPTKAALARVGRALIEGTVSVRRYLTMGDEYMILVECTPSAMAALRDAARASHVVYKSPTRLFGSTLVPRFDSAEDEMNGRESQRYRKLAEAAAERLLAAEAARRAAEPVEESHGDHAD